MMGIAQKIEKETVIYKNYKKETGENVLFLPFTNFSAPQKLRFLCQNLSDIHEDTGCISSSDSMVLVLSLVKDEDEFLPKKRIFQEGVESVKWRNMIRIVKDVDLECTICLIGKTILLLLCLLKIPKVFNLLLLYFKMTFYLASIS